MIDPIDGVARERGPGLGNRTPYLGGVYRPGQTVECGTGSAAGDQDFSGGEQGRVEMAPLHRHRAGPSPGRRRRVEIDQFRGVGGPPTTHVENLAGLVHHRRTVVATAVEPAADRKPDSGAVWIEVRSRLLFAGVEDESVGCEEGTRIVLQRLRGAGQRPDARPDEGRATGPDLRHRHLSAVLVASGQDHHVAVGHDCSTGIPAAATHRDRAAPALGHWVEDADVGQAVVDTDVAPGSEYPAVGKEGETGTEEL